MEYGKRVAMLSEGYRDDCLEESHVVDVLVVMETKQGPRGS